MLKRALTLLGLFGLLAFGLAGTGASAPPRPTLTVTKNGTGAGTVTSSPAGINCGATCSAQFSKNTAVTLTEVPAAGSTFAGWSGACTGTGSCVVTMSGNKSVTATFNLVTPPACGNTVVYPPDTTYGNTPPIDPQARPAYLTCVTDSTYGNHLTRVSDQAAFGTTDTILKQNYPLLSPWNADESLLLLDYGFWGWGYLLDGQTHAFLRKINIPNGRHSARWSSTNPDNLFLTNNVGNEKGNQLLVCHPKSDTSATPVTTVLHTFSQYDAAGGLNFGMDKGDFSWDGSVGAVAGWSTSQGKWGITTFSVSNQTSASPTITEIATFWVDSAIYGSKWSSLTSGYPEFAVTPNGDGVVVYGVGGFYWAPPNFSSAPTLFNTSSGAHADIGKNLAGEQVWAVLGGSGQVPGAQITGQKLDASGPVGAAFKIQSFVSGMQALSHISAKSKNRPGWFYVSDLDNNPVNPKGYEQMYAIKMDGSETIEVFGVDHCPQTSGNNNLAPLAVPNRDGSQVLFGSSWNSSTDPVYAYIATFDT